MSEIDEAAVEVALEAYWDRDPTKQPRGWMRDVLTAYEAHRTRAGLRITPEMREQAGRAAMRVPMPPLNDCQGEHTDADARWQEAVRELAGLISDVRPLYSLPASQAERILNAAVERAVSTMRAELSDVSGRLFRFVQAELDERCTKDDGGGERGGLAQDAQPPK